MAAHPQRHWARPDVPKKRISHKSSGHFIMPKSRCFISSFVFLSLTLSLWSSLTFAQTSASEEIIARVDEYVNNAVDALGIPGASLALVHRGEVIHLNQWGITGRSISEGRSRAVTRETPFLVGSNSKALTVYGLMTLVQDGLLELDDPLQAHLPEFTLSEPKGASAITLRHLISHTSGISARAGYELSDRHNSEARVASWITRELAFSEPIGRPGEVYEYSPANYALLAAVIETVTGINFPEYMQRRVFQPLGMEQASAHVDEALGKGWTPGYRSWFGWVVPFAPLFDTRGAAYGYMAASAEDMGRFLAALQNAGGVLAPEFASRLMEPLVETGHNVHYGYGWRIYETTDYKKVWHSGSTADFRSEILLLPGSGWGAVLLTNRSNGVEAGRLSQVALGIEAIFNGQEPRSVVAGVPLERMFFYGFTGFALLIVMGLVWRAGKPKVVSRWRWATTAVVCAALAVSLVPVLVHVTGFPWRSLWLFIPDVVVLVGVNVFLFGLASLLSLRLYTQRRAARATH